MPKVQEVQFSRWFICLCSWANLKGWIACMATDIYAINSSHSPNLSPPQTLGQTPASRVIKISSFPCRVGDNSILIPESTRDLNISRIHHLVKPPLFLHQFKNRNPSSADSMLYCSSPKSPFSENMRPFEHRSARNSSSLSMFSASTIPNWQISPGFSHSECKPLSVQCIRWPFSTLARVF